MEWGFEIGRRKYERTSSLYRRRNLSQQRERSPLLKRSGKEGERKKPKNDGGERVLG